MEERLAENEQKSLFYDMEMPLIYVLADMEKYGIKVDKAALLAYQKRLGESLDGMEEEIYALAGEKFNINSPKQLGVILFEKLGLKGGKRPKRAIPPRRMCWKSCGRRIPLWSGFCTTDSWRS